MQGVHACTYLIYVQYERHITSKSSSLSKTAQYSEHVAQSLGHVTHTQCLLHVAAFRVRCTVPRSRCTVPGERYAHTVPTACCRVEGTLHTRMHILKVGQKTTSWHAYMHSSYDRRFPVREKKEEGGWCYTVYRYVHIPLCAHWQNHTVV
jgi:hypothetical protein